MSHHAPNYIGYLDDVPQRRVYLRIELRERGHVTELSISGEAGDGSAGQIDMHISPEDITPGKGRTRAQIERLWATWDRWHLNGMNAECRHQRLIAQACGVKPHEFWVTSFRNDFRAAMCPVCGYEYGSAWLREQLPACVVEWLRTNFDVTERTHPC